MILLAATPLEAFRDMYGDMFSFQSMLRSAVYQKFIRWAILAISLGKVVVSFLQIAIHLSTRTYEKLQSKGEPYRFSG